MDPPTNPSFSLPDHLHASSGAQDLVAADLSLQLGLATPQYPELNSLEFNGQRVTGKLLLDQPQQSPANSESSVNQRGETPLSSNTSSDISHFRKLLRKVNYRVESRLSSNTSSDISHFRKLLRKVNYKVELTSDTQGIEATSGTAMMDGRRKIDDKSAVHKTVESLLTRSNGAKMKCTSYLPGFYYSRDQTVEASGSLWRQFNNSVFCRSGRDYNILFQPPSVDQYLAYNEEGLRQTMLKHEAIFKCQVNELHRLYGRQRELMDEIN